MKKLIYIFLFTLFVAISACEKNVTVVIPEATTELVVEGYIEPGKSPIVLLTRSLPFFGEINVNNIFQNTVTGAIVIVDDGLQKDTLTQFGNFGIYTSSTMLGQIGRTYSLKIIAGDQSVSAVTTLPPPIPFDSLWWKVDGTRDSLGFLWAHLSDPDTLGNSYRIFMQRINRYTYGPEIGRQKDSTFTTPPGSVFEDRYINGKRFDLSFPRGSFQNSTKEEDDNKERLLYKRGDTIVVKFCTIDRAHFEFWRTEESQISSNGNPFGSPQPVHSNIVGGLGVWGGYTPSYDTVIAR